MSTAQEAMSDVVKLKSHYEDKEIHKDMINKDNFLTATSSMSEREAEMGKPMHGHGSVLPRHPPGHGQMCLDTTQRVDYQYPYEWRSCTPSVSGALGISESVWLIVILDAEKENREYFY